MSDDVPVRLDASPDWGEFGSEAAERLCEAWWDRLYRGVQDELLRLDAAAALETAQNMSEIEEYLTDAERADYRRAEAACWQKECERSTPRAVDETGPMERLWIAQLQRARRRWRAAGDDAEADR